MLKRCLSGLISLLCVMGVTAVPLWADADSPAKKAEFSPELIKRGEPLFNHYCAHCHGLQGDADGYNADYLDKEPAELSSYEFVSKKSNQQLFRVIQKGGRGVKKSHLMPVFGHTLSEKEIWELVAYVRFLAKDLTNPISLPDSLADQRPEQAAITPQMIQSFSQWFGENGRNEDVVKLGQSLFENKKSCFACHSAGEEDEDGEILGGRVGPDLSRAGFLYSPEWLFTWIRNPQVIKPNTKMPNIGLNDDEDRAVTAFLASLKGEATPDEWKVYLEEPGDPTKGERLFKDSEGKAFCVKCHTVQGEGGKVGPELSHVGSTRTKAFLLESILNPKEVITVGYKAILILTKKGKFLTGVKVNEDESALDIVDKEGNSLHVLKKDIKKFKMQKISIMPSNFIDILSVEEIRDILAYLSTLKISELSEAGTGQ